MAEEETIESQIKVAMASRIPHFRQQSDSLTFKGVRRLLEKDLGLDKYALKVHKIFVEQLLSEFMDGDDDDITKDSEKTVDKNVSTAGDVAASSENNLADENGKESNTKEEGKIEESPVMGLLKESELPETRVVETEDTPKNESPSEITVKEAMSKRAAYLKANSENVTMAGVRRLLEKDLKLDKFTLDPFKKLIREEIDKVFASKASSLSTDKKKKSVQRKTSKKVRSGGSSNSSDNGSDDVEEVKPRKKVVRKEKVQTSKMPIKRKRPEKETKVSRKKQSKLAKMTSEEVSGDDDGNDSEDGQSHSSEEKPVKKKEVSTPAAYGKDVERLKSIIKACGMSVPPIVYKKAEQVPENKREDFIVKELEKILEKEELSRKPDEKGMHKEKKIPKFPSLKDPLCSKLTGFKGAKLLDERRFRMEGKGKANIVVQEFEEGIPEGMQARIGSRVGVRYRCMVGQEDSAVILHTNVRDIEPFYFCLGMENEINT